LVQASLT
jgi:hypothetical protein